MIAWESMRTNLFISGNAFSFADMPSVKSDRVPDHRPDRLPRGKSPDHISFHSDNPHSHTHRKTSDSFSELSRHSIGKPGARQSSPWINFRIPAGTGIGHRILLIYTSHPRKKKYRVRICNVRDRRGKTIIIHTMPSI